jgi:spermidine synthase
MPAAYRRGAVYAFYFLAGICGLTYEVVWSRILGAHLGNVDVANAVVLATFMGGLALGARIFGPWADRMHHPLRAYGLIEAAIGLYALGSPFLLALAGDGPLDAGRVGLAAVALLPPTILMGGAFPLLTRYLTSRTLELRRNVGHLYAVNTAGSVLGGLLAGFWLLDALTPTAALATMGVLNLALGAFVVAAAGRAPARLTATEAPELAGLDDAVSYGASARRLALLLAGFSGVATMALEVAWTRELANALGDSTHGLTLMLAAFLSGSALGAVALASRRAGRFALPDLVGAALLGTSVLLFVTHHLYAALVEALTAAGGPPVAVYLLCFAALLLPTTAAGLIFPAAVRLGADEQHVGGRVGHIYAVNTLGTLAGAVFAGLVVLPRWGTEVVFTGAVVAYALAGLAVTRRRVRAPRPPMPRVRPGVFSLSVRDPDAREDEVV